MSSLAPSTDASLPRVIVVGGGFGGLNCVRALRRSPVRVTLVDRRNFHLFQPLLYQVATGGLSPANIAAPLRWILRRQKNCDVVLSQVVGFDLAGRRVFTEDGDLAYDFLVVAAGARHSYFGRDDWADLAPGLKSIEDATQIRGRVYAAFEQAEQTTDPALRRALLNFAIIGGGPTGVELAGALAEIARHSLKHDFRRINPSEAQILLVEAGPRVLGGFSEALSAKAAETLLRLGVTVRTATRATAIARDHVDLRSETGDESWPTRTVLWAAGVQASPLTRALASACGAQLDRAGRIKVRRDLSLPGHDDAFALGDKVDYSHLDGRPLPGVAPVAIQQGKFVARVIVAKLRGAAPPEFRYRELGNLATIGRSAAVAQFGKFGFSGWFAWAAWLFIHLMNLVSFRNRVLVISQWAWNYFTYDRSARLITGEAPSDADLEVLERLAAPDELLSNGPSF
jgi:NADH dehydrogenase